MTITFSFSFSHDNFTICVGFSIGSPLTNLPLSLERAGVQIVQEYQYTLSEEFIRTGYRVNLVALLQI